MVRVAVHGDDFTMSGERKELVKTREKMKNWYDIKNRGIIGSEAGEIKEVVCLGRKVRWKAEGIEYEADENTQEDVDE